MPPSTNCLPGVHTLQDTVVLIEKIANTKRGKPGKLLSSRELIPWNNNRHKRVTVNPAYADTVRFTVNKLNGHLHEVNGRIYATPTSNECDTY